MFFSKFLALALIASSTSNAFVVVSPSTATSCPSFNLGASSKRHDDERAKTNDNAIRNFAAVSAITCGLLFPSSGAFAESAIRMHELNDHAVLSSALDLSKAITTMDFSLPSSYDKISDPVASGKDELTSTIVIETGARKRSAASSESSSSKKKSPPKSSSSGLSLNKVIALPSSSSSGSSMKEEAAAALAERIAQRKSMEAEQAARDEQAARERDANIKAAREEKIARRAAEQAEKAAAALAKEQEARYEGVTFVDTSMPKY